MRLKESVSPMKLVLYFDHNTLREIEFSSRADNVPRRSIRGKVSFGRYTGSFPWSSSVRAFCLFVIGEYLSRIGVTEQPYLFSGGAKSAAATLDFALDKEPSWLKEAFGVDTENNSLIKRLIFRENPRQRREAQVSICFRKSTDVDFEIGIRRSSDRSNLSSDEIARVRSHIEMSFSRSGLEASIERREECSYPDATIVRCEDVVSLPSDYAIKPGLPGIFADQSYQSILREEFKKEIHGALFRTEMFSRPGRFMEQLRELHSHPHFVHIAGRGRSVISEVDETLAFPGRVGFGIQESVFEPLRSADPLTIAVGPGGITTILMVLFLQRVRGLNIRVEYRFPNSQNLTSDICARTFERQADAVILSPACAARVVGKKTDYHPLMIMPGTSNRIIGGRAAKSITKSGQFIFMTDAPSSSTFYHHDLIDQGTIRRDIGMSLQVEPDEVIGYMQDVSSDAKAILWWPYYMFQTRLGLAVDLEAQKDRWMYFMTTLFVHQSLYRDRRRAIALDIALRDAWLSLRANSIFIDKMLDELLTDTDYTTCLYRFNGLHNLSSSGEVFRC